MRDSVRYISRQLLKIDESIIDFSKIVSATLYIHYSFRPKNILGYKNFTIKLEIFPCVGNKRNFIEDKEVENFYFYDFLKSFTSVNSYLVYKELNIVGDKNHLVNLFFHVKTLYNLCNDKVILTEENDSDNANLNIITKYRTIQVRELFWKEVKNERV